MTPKTNRLIIIFAIVTILIPIPCIADHHRHDQDHSEKNLFLFPIHFFRKYISGVDGDRCPMHPSCSTYSLEAFKKHGALKGWIMTCDRLIRCGRDETRLSPPVIARGKTRTHDPIEQNDFWRNRPGEP